MLPGHPYDASDQSCAMYRRCVIPFREPTQPVVAFEDTLNISLPAPWTIAIGRLVEKEKEMITPHLALPGPFPFEKNTDTEMGIYAKEDFPTHHQKLA